MPEHQYHKLESAWKPARANGALGRASIEDLAAHTAGYVAAVCAVLGRNADDVDGLGIDVGSGAGVPGIFLALALPAMRWRLVDANEQRCDFARSAVRAVGLQSRVSVHHSRAEDLGHAVAWREAHDIAVSRLLGPPAETAELLIPLVRAGGVVVVSTQETAEKSWNSAPLRGFGVASVEDFDHPAGAFVTLTREGSVPPALPRRRSLRQRSPLFGSGA
jgi:16S rRNA (guanine527-N7)-methyltransferase